jgi:apolipoprotein N-acyltransferase
MLRGILLSTLSAALLACAMPGVGCFPLAFVALVPWAIATERAEGKLARFATDFALGLVYFGVRTIWLGRILWIDYIPVLIAPPLFFVLAGFLYRRLRRRLPAAAALPSAWLAAEVLRSIRPIIFPWDLLGYAAAGWLDLAGLAAIAGPFGLTVLLGFTNGAVVDAIRTRGARRRIAIAAPLVVVSAGALAGGWLRRDVGPLVEGPLFGCVQPNIPQSMKQGAVPGFETVLRKLFSLTKEAGQKGADVVVIPETMFPADILRGATPNANFGGHQVSEYLESEKLMLERFRRLIGPRPWLITGAMLYDRTSPGDEALRLRNSALLFDPNNREVGRYDKVFLVPGSEAIDWIPEGWFADRVRDALDPYTNGMVPQMIPGGGAAVFEIAPIEGKPAARAGMAICYDNAFPSLFRESAARNANFHLVLSNEGWFPDSYEMDSMLAYSAFRAIETRRSVLRCTNTGISCLIDPDGSLASILTVDGRRSEVEGVFLARPKLGNSKTPYVTVGDIPAYALAVLAALAALLLPRRCELKPGPPSP